MVDIFKLDTPAEDETKDKHKNDILLVKDYLNTVISGFNVLAGTTEVNDDEIRVWLDLITRSFHSLICANRLAISGFYSQSLALSRQVTECYLLCENTSDRTVHDYFFREGKKPNFCTLACQMDNMTVYEGDFRFESKMVHASALSLSVLEDYSNMLRVFPTYEDKLYLACTEALLRKGLLISQYMYKSISRIKGEDAALEWDKNNADVIKKISNWLTKLRVKYGG